MPPPTAVALTQSKPQVPEKPDWKSTVQSRKAAKEAEDRAKAEQAEDEAKVKAQQAIDQTQQTAAQLENIYASRSWRLTAPFRKLMSLLR
jgi:hypothetical protein